MHKKVVCTALLFCTFSIHSSEQKTVIVTHSGHTLRCPRNIIQSFDTRLRNPHSDIILNLYGYPRISRRGLSTLIGFLEDPYKNYSAKSLLKAVAAGKELMGYRNRDLQTLRLITSAKQALEKGEPQLFALLRTWSDKDAQWLEEYLKSKQNS